MNNQLSRIIQDQPALSGDAQLVDETAIRAMDEIDELIRQVTDGNGPSDLNPRNPEHSKPRKELL